MAKLLLNVENTIFLKNRKNKAKYIFIKVIRINKSDIIYDVSLAFE